MFNKVKQTTETGLGLRISARADADSSVSTLLGITSERRIELEEAVFCEQLIQSNNISIIKSISETAKTANELAYSMYYFGTLSSNPPVHEEKEVGDVDLNGNGEPVENF